MKKIDLGQFNTKRDVWLKPQVEAFIRMSQYNCGLDPFAGEGDLVKVMLDLGLKKIRGLDIDRGLDWIYNDSLVDIPYYEDTIVVTNPPYYARVSASRRDSSCMEYFKRNNFSDLYQLAIANVMKKYEEAVFIIPETYFLTEDMFFKEDLCSITILEDNPFYDTDCPVCVACFQRGNPLEYPEYDIYKNEEFLFNNRTLEGIKDWFKSKNKLKIKFNDPEGNIGLRGVDGTNPENRIKFCRPEELNYNFDNIKISSRAITVLNVKGNFDRDKLIEQANEHLEALREFTSDVIFAPFKGNNKAGIRRRRLDFKWAKKILNKALTNVK